jgi:hypothetical protein
VSIVHVPWCGIVRLVNWVLKSLWDLGLSLVGLLNRWGSNVMRKSVGHVARGGDALLSVSGLGCYLCWDSLIGVQCDTGALGRGWIVRTLTVARNWNLTHASVALLINLLSTAWRLVWVRNIIFISWLGTDSSKSAQPWASLVVFVRVCIRVQQVLLLLLLLGFLVVLLLLRLMIKVAKLLTLVIVIIINVHLHIIIMVVSLSKLV